MRKKHCPKCQGLARAEWLADRHSELLPVPYFHVVFTVPAPIAEIARHNKAVVYSILFTSAAETLRVIAADPRRRSGEGGARNNLLHGGLHDALCLVHVALGGRGHHRAGGRARLRRPAGGASPKMRWKGLGCDRGFS